MHKMPQRRAISREALERLSVFLPASVVHALKEQVPPGQRRAFIARALAEALERQVQTEEG